MSISWSRSSSAMHPQRFCRTVENERAGDPSGTAARSARRRRSAWYRSTSEQGEVVVDLPVCHPAVEGRPLLLFNPDVIIDVVLSYGLAEGPAQDGIGSQIAG